MLFLKCNRRRACFPKAPGLIPSWVCAPLGLRCGRPAPQGRGNRMVNNVTEFTAFLYVFLIIFPARASYCLTGPKLLL